VSSVITGATKVSQIEDNMLAADVELTDAHITQIDEILAS
jgi:aryl-alcohol dehydrogenase-like predicted oxidoreductase